METRSVRKRKMVPKARNIPTAYPQPSGETFGSTGETLPQSMGAGGNDLSKKNGSDTRSGTNSTRPMFSQDDLDLGIGFRETSLTEPLLNGNDSDSDSAARSIDGVTVVTPPEPKYPQEEEKSWQIALQVFIPYMIAGFGMVAAGLVLDVVQHWAVFEHVPEVFILVPALLGLKGNLEMTLASRLSTQANLGNMDIPAEMWRMVAGNLALTQAQAIVVGFFASIFAMVLGWIPEGKFTMTDAFLLSASSVLTASMASLVLGSVMIGVIIFSRKFHINPDNVATPIAASLGDLTTLTVLAAISNLLFKTLGLSPEYAASAKEYWLCPFLLVLFLALVPVWCVVSHRNKYVHDVLYDGWVPVIGAMLISSVGGLILDFAVKTYHGIAVFQPVINGVGGNLVAVQASRLSTSLHLSTTPGVLPDDVTHGCPNPISSFFGKGINARTARVLLAMVIPGQVVFMYVINFLQAGHTSITLIFSACYLSACMIQVVILLYVSAWMVHYLWKKGCDPDNYSIPYLTALGDLLGGFLLAITFHLLYLVGDRDADVGD